jgi:superfamily II DNA helicase RecQ
MPNIYKRVHSNGVTTKIQEWATGFDYGLEVPRSGEAGVHKCRSREEAEAAANQLAHAVCNERCGQWEEIDSR